MGGLHLDIISPELRKRVLSYKIDRNYSDGVSPISYNYDLNPFNEPLNSLNPQVLHRMVYPQYGTFSGIKNTGKTNVEFNITDGYEGGFRRDDYPKQWDKRTLIDVESRTPNIYADINMHVMENFDKHSISSLWRERDGYIDYIHYTNSILGRHTPTGRSGTETHSGSFNLLAAMVRGDGIGLSLNSSGEGVGVVTDFDINQTLAGRIFSTATGKDTPMGRFGMKAAAISMANNVLAKQGKLVSALSKATGEAITESTRWVARNSVGRMFGRKLGDKLFGEKGFDLDFDITEFGNSRITNPPGVMDDIMMATGLNTAINPIIGGLGIAGLFDDNNKTQTATSANDGKYVHINVDDVLISTNYKEDLRPNFELFLDPLKRRGRGYVFLSEGGIWGKTPILNKKGTKVIGYEKIVVSESEYRRLQQDVLLDWTGALNAKMIFEHLDRNLYGPGYTKKRAKKEIGLEDKSYLSGFPGLSYKPRVDDTYIKNGDYNYKRTTTTWTENYGYSRKINGDYVETEGTSDFERFYMEENVYDQNGELIGTQVVPTQVYQHGDVSYSSIHGYLPTNSLLEKTKKLFINNKIGTMISRFAKVDEEPSFIQSSAVPKFGISKGRALLNKNAELGVLTNVGYVDPWCRVWTWERQYRNIQNAIRPFLKEDNLLDPGNLGNPVTLKELHEKIKIIRPFLDEFVDNTSLQNNGLPKIAPYRSDYTKWLTDFPYKEKDGKRIYEKQNRWKYNRNYMFSIENLAWKDLDLENILCPSQIGPNGGRIYWFSPLNLKFDDTTQVKLNTEEFIGRGEPLYSYINTTRTGSLNFTIIVDHSSYHEYMQHRKDLDTEKKNEAYQGILRFDAGCDIPEIAKEKECKIIKKQKKKTTHIVPPEYTPEIKGEEYYLVKIYFPNDFSGVAFHRNTEKNKLGNNGGGTDTMDYLYLGGGSKEGGTLPLIDGKNTNGVGWGYEMDWIRTPTESGISILSADKANSSMTLSNVDKSNNQMRTWDHIKEANKIHWKRTEDSGNSEMTILYAPFLLNMHMTDPMSGFYEGSVSSVKLPGGRPKVLPRKQYFQGISNWDVDNFKLNATPSQGAKLSFAAFYEICKGMGDDAPHKNDWGGWTKDKLKETLKNAEIVIIGGSASQDGNGHTGDDNSRLAKYRAMALAQFIFDTLEVDVTKNPNNKDYKFEYEDEHKKAEDSHTEFSSDMKSKSFRYAYIKVKTKGAKSEEVANSADKWVDIKDEEPIIEYPVSGVTRYDEEMDFYEYVSKDTDLTWSNVRDRYNKYIPGLWSCTPEGFNARLTFLHQCTRQGPTNSATDTNLVTNIANLSFGRPPVCILKIGDFIQSKIFIQNLNIDFGTDGIQWDMNPEGIGIQPMIANVHISFVYMGGQDLTGAIAKLQNAVTFNYYANASVYDDRADVNTFIPGTSRTEDGKPKTAKRGGDTGKPISALFDPYNYKNGRVYFDECDGKEEKIIDLGITKEDTITHKPGYKRVPVPVPEKLTPIEPKLETPKQALQMAPNYKK